MKLFFYRFCILLALTVVATQVYGAEGGVTYKSMVNVPGLEGTSLTTEEYVNTLYFLSITVAGLLAVVQIIYGGVQYMLTDVITHKGDATKRIKGALLGLLIILSAVLILETINPNLLELNILKNAPALKVTSIADSATTETVNIPFGSRVNTSDKAGVKRLKDNCKGVVANEGQALGRTGVNTVVCYANPSSMNARVGDTLNTSIYPPASRDQVATTFKNTCEANGGIFGDNAFGLNDVCESSDSQEDTSNVAQPII